MLLNVQTFQFENPDCHTQKTKNTNPWFETLTQTLIKMILKDDLDMKNIDAAGIFKNTTNTTKCVAISSEYIVNSVTKYPLRIPVQTFFSNF